MTPHALVTHARRGWQDEVHDLHPGAHVAVFADNADAGIEGRLVGLELRDTLLVLRSGPKANFIFLFRVPLKNRLSYLEEEYVSEFELRLVSDPAVLCLSSPKDRKTTLQYSLRSKMQVIEKLRMGLGENATTMVQVMETGTGCINVDCCRVGTTKRVPGGLSRTAGRSLSGSVDGSLRRETGEEGGHNPNIGRWPTNVVLVHEGTCTGSCEPTCPVALVDDKGAAFGVHGSAALLYPRFSSEDDLVTWVETMITPP